MSSSMNSGTYSLSNVLNYIPSNIRDIVADDDKILSIAYQALEKLHLFETTFVRDIVFTEIKNHKVVLPEDFRRIESVKYLANIITGWQDTYTVQQILEENAWVTMTSVAPSSLNFMQSVDFQDTQFLYTLTNNEIYTSQLEGLVAIEYYRLNTDCKEEIQLPKDPQELWEYMANYFLAKHWEGRIPESGAYHLWMNYLNMASNLKESTKRKINISNLDYYGLRHIILGDNRYAHLVQRLQNENRH